MPGRESITRRGLLAVVGTSATAGCSGLWSLDDEQRDTIESYHLPDIDEESALEPTVQPSVPVEIGQAHLATARERATGLLATLPLPMGPDDVPNGHVRQDLGEAADEATDRLDEALVAETQLSALRTLRRARERARYAAAGWAVVEDGLTRERIREEHRRGVADGRSVRENHTYVGRDPIRATLVHARIEQALARATDGARVGLSHDSSHLLTVAAWGEEAEAVRARVADARHLAAQFAASLPDDAGTVETTLGGAAERLFADVRSRQSDLPPEPTADDWGLEEKLVDQLRWMAADQPRRVADAPGIATAVVDANGQLAAIRALQSVHSRLEDGGSDEYQIESAADLRSLRADAYDELQVALEESPAPELARTVLTGAAGRIASADWELSRFEGEARPSRFDGVVEGYVVGAALARATPEACRQTVDALAGA